MNIFKLQQLRQEKGLSQDDLSKTLKVSRYTIINYETGKRLPDLEFSLKAANLFNVSLDYLYGLSPYRNQEDYESLRNSFMPQNYKVDKKVIYLNLEKIIKNAKELNFEEDFVSSLNSLLVEIDIFLETYNKFKIKFERIDAQLAKIDNKIDFLENLNLVFENDFIVNQKFNNLVELCRQSLKKSYRQYLEDKLELKINLNFGE